LVAIFILLLCADRANAYVGPGGGLELTGYFLSLAAWMMAAFSMVLMYPFYALLRRFRGDKTKVVSEAAMAPVGNSPEAAGAASHTTG
jgi:hypothetical protein